ncbi:MAG: helix-hairpin-helix domain-containing protein [Bacteroidetes bacterium]|nr:helix-hairpin-helix domain-containing protein [Bacteroidota bacterium]
MMKQLLKEYFAMGKWMRRAYAILLLAISLVLLLRFLLPVWANTKSALSFNDCQVLLNQMKADSFEHARSSGQISVLKPFVFNPNTLDSAGFVGMGMRHKLIATLMNYRRKGGHFYRAASFEKLYGLRPEEYEQLKDFVQIPDETPAYKKPEPQMVELNTADTTELIALPMIGAYTARQIVQYKKQLGGFVRPDQLLEIKSIKPEQFDQFKKWIRINPRLVRKINLNEATFQEMNAHPYLKGALADAICALRKTKQYQLNNLNELKEIELMNEEIFRKIAPYLMLQ